MLSTKAIRSFLIMEFSKAHILLYFCTLYGYFHDLVLCFAFIHIFERSFFRYSVWWNSIFCFLFRPTQRYSILLSENFHSILLLFIFVYKINSKLRVVNLRTNNQTRLINLLQCGSQYEIKRGVNIFIYLFIYLFAVYLTTLPIAQTIYHQMIVD
jgi:hypothetical protein